MNMYLKEMKDQIRSLLIWSLGIALFILVAMMKFKGFQGNNAEVTELMNAFPDAVKAAFGIGALDLTTLPGYYSIMVVYFLLILTIQAAMMGGHLLAREEIDKTAEFLLPKPVSRVQVVTAKLVAGLTSALVLNVFMLVATLIFVGIFNEGEAVTTEIVVINGYIYLLQVLFLMMGLAISAASKNSKIAGSVTTGVILFTYFLSVMIDMNFKLERWVYLTPFKYFDAKNIFLDRPYDPIFYGITGGAILVMMAMTYLFYRRKDIPL